VYLYNILYLSIRYIFLFCFVSFGLPALQKIERDEEWKGEMFKMGMYVKPCYGYVSIQLG
jgi:hypothetical protein